MAIYADEAHQLPKTIYVRVNDRTYNWNEPELLASTDLDPPFGEHEFGEYTLVRTIRMRKRGVVETLP